MRVPPVAIPLKDTPSDKAQGQQGTRPQSSKAETVQKPKSLSAHTPEGVESKYSRKETKPVEIEEQTTPVQNDRRSEASND